MPVDWTNNINNINVETLWCQNSLLFTYVLCTGAIPELESTHDSIALHTHLSYK